MGLKTGPAGDRPTSHCLRGWWWGGDGDRDHSLYDRDGLTIVRIVLQDDGRYHLQKPIAIPGQAWAHLEEAKRGAENFALHGNPRFATYRPAPDGRQSCGGQPPTRSNARETPCAPRRAARNL